MRITDNERDARKSGELLGSALGVTAGDEDPGFGILGVDFADGVASLGVSGRSDGTCIDDHEFRIIRRGGWSAATIAELALDGGTVGMGGAAAKLFDVKSSHESEQEI